MVLLGDRLCGELMSECRTARGLALGSGHPFCPLSRLSIYLYIYIYTYLYMYIAPTCLPEKEMRGGEFEVHGPDKR